MLKFHVKSEINISNKMSVVEYPQTASKMFLLAVLCLNVIAAHETKPMSRLQRQTLNNGLASGLTGAGTRSVVRLIYRILTHQSNV